MKELLLNTQEKLVNCMPEFVPFYSKMPLALAQVTGELNTVTQTGMTKRFPQKLYQKTAVAVHITLKLATW
jgi:hypothetical protein